MTIEQTILAYSDKMSDGYHRIHDYLGLISALEGREEELRKSKQLECEQLRAEAKKWWKKYMDEMNCKK